MIEELDYEVKIYAPHGFQFAVSNAEELVADYPTIFEDEPSAEEVNILSTVCSDLHESDKYENYSLPCTIYAKIGDEGESDVTFKFKYATTDHFDNVIAYYEYCK